MYRLNMLSECTGIEMQWWRPRCCLSRGPFNPIGGQMCGVEESLRRLTGHSSAALRELEDKVGARDIS
jgi:hypothetical protein